MQHPHCFRPAVRTTSEARVIHGVFFPTGGSIIPEIATMGAAHAQLDALKQSIRDQNHKKTEQLMSSARNIIGFASKEKRAEFKDWLEGYQKTRRQNTSQRLETNLSGHEQVLFRYFTDVLDGKIPAPPSTPEKTSSSSTETKPSEVAQDPGKVEEGTNWIERRVSPFLPNNSWGTLAVTAGAGGLWYFLTRLGTKAQNRWWRALGHTARWLGLAGLATVAASKISALNKGPLSGPEKGKMEDALAAIDNATKNSPEGELGEFWKVKDGKSGWEWDGEEKSIIYAPMIAQGGLDGYWHIKIDGKKFGTTEESRFKWDEKKRRHFFVVGKDVTDATVIFNGTFNGEPVVPAKEYRIHRSDTATVAPEVKMPIAKEPEAFDEKDLPPSMNFLEGPKTFTFQRQSYTVNVNAAEGMITVNNKTWFMKATPDEVKGNLAQRTLINTKNAVKSLARFQIHNADWKNEGTKKVFFIKATGSLKGVAPETGQIDMDAAQSVEFLRNLTSDKQEVETLNPRVKLVRQR